MKATILNFLKLHETKIVLIFGFILVASLSFEAGFLQGKKAEISPLIIEKAFQNSEIEPGGPQNQEPLKDTTATENKAQIGNSALPQNCAYVGSKNSNKYHLPSCRYAKLIKPENVVCFKSVEEATAKNYLPDKGCIK
jgi:hypothetical protein